MKLLNYLGIAFWSIALLLPQSGFSQTNVSGTITTNSTWTLANSPYVLTGSVTVNPGVTLTIEPGVVVKFESLLYNIRIRGKLTAIGTVQDSIVFTSYKDDQYGGDTNGDGNGK